MLQDKYWQAVLERDRQLDRVFFYGVISTRIYCLPSCPARKPKRINILFFDTWTAAEEAGFRSCKRCHPRLNLLKQPNTRIVELCREIEQNIDKLPNFTQLAKHFNLSSSYLQRIFKRTVGITPKQYAQACRFTLFKQKLKQNQNISEAIYLSGYNSSSSLYNRISSKLGMTPKTYQQHGKQKLLDREKKL